MSAEQKAFGDFQTPPALATAVCQHLAETRRPASVLEPTCGTGAFLAAARTAFPEARRVVGIDVRPEHLAGARARLGSGGCGVTLIEADIFTLDLPRLLAELPEPILIVGNPPWVTSADQGRRGSTNLPKKHNARNEPGLSARTGKANFDVAEWILLRLVESLSGRRATFALLVKSSTARRTLAHLWQLEAPVSASRFLRIDAGAAFGVAVDAGLLELELGAGPRSATCAVSASLESSTEERGFGLVDGVLVADVARYQEVRGLVTGRGEPWRSGIKHDCARVLELSTAPSGGGLVNGLGEACDVEPEHVFPLLKSTDLARGTEGPPRRWLLVPQRSTGEDTALLAARAPRTHDYLGRHAEALARRKSSIYRGRPPYSIFGVGPYSFAPWKVAISGLHKAHHFRLVGPHAGRPTVLDDTSYFLSFPDEAGAREALELLRSLPCQELLASLVFQDAKRPVTAEVLRRIDLDALRSHLAGTGRSTAGR